MATSPMRVCIIAAKTFIHDHPKGTFDVTIFERSDSIGGLWPVSAIEHVPGMIHPDMCTNQSRHTVSFSGLAWSESTPQFPKAWQVGQYLERYAETYQLPKVQTNTNVVKVSRSEDRLWKVDVTAAKEGSSSTPTAHKFDKIIVATGFFGKPNEHQPGGSGKPTCHSSEFRTVHGLLTNNGLHAPSRARKIVVAGGQMSGVEVAALIAKQISSAANSSDEKDGLPNADEYTVHHIHQMPFWVMPLFFPKDPMQDGDGDPVQKIPNPSSTFLPIDLITYNLTWRPPGPITNTSGHISASSAQQTHTFFQTYVGNNQSSYGPCLTIAGDVLSQPPCLTVSEEYPEFVRSRNIQLLKGHVTGCLKDNPHTITIQDGEQEQHLEDVAAIIYATGYEPSPSIDFLSPSLLQSLNFSPESRKFPLALNFHSTASASIPDLGFVGFYRSPYWGVMEMQARFLGKLWTNEPLAIKALEEDETMAQMLELRTDPLCAQFPMGDYAYLMESFSSAVGIPRIDTEGQRSGIVLPARYPNPNLTTEMAESSAALEIIDKIFTDSTNAKFVARAVFRAFQGDWKLDRKIDSAISSFPSGEFKGTAKFLPRFPTDKEFDFDTNSSRSSPSSPLFSVLPVLRVSDPVTAASGSHSSPYEDGESYAVASYIIASVRKTVTAVPHSVRELVDATLPGLKQLKSRELFSFAKRNSCGTPFFNSCPSEVDASSVALAETTEKRGDLNGAIVPLKIRSEDKNTPPCGLPFPPCSASAGSSLRPPMPFFFIAGIIKSVKAVPVGLAQESNYEIIPLEARTTNESTMELVRSDENPRSCGFPFPPCPGSAASSLRAPAPFIFITKLIRAVNAIPVLPKKIELGSSTAKKSSIDEDVSAYGLISIQHKGKTLIATLVQILVLVAILQSLGFRGLKKLDLIDSKLLIRESKTILDSMHMLEGPQLPSDTINAVLEALQLCRANQKTVGKSYVTDIDRQLEDAENKVCRRLDAPAYNVILAIIILADYCRDGERIMYMLGAGILCIQLLQGCEHNLEALECGSEEHRRQLGVVILEESNEIIKTICAQIIRVAVETGIHRELFWPNETEMKYYEGFPSASQNNISWNELYQSYMDLLWKLLDEPEQPGHVFFAQSIFTVPDSKFQILHYTVSGCIAYDNITMLATCMPGSFDQCLEIPLDSITKVTVETTQGATKGKLWNLVLDLSGKDEISCHLDSVGIILQKICMVLSQENVTGVVNELQNMCPDLEIIGWCFGVEAEEGVAPEPPSSLPYALVMGIDATTESSPQASQNSTPIVETKSNYRKNEVIDKDRQGGVSEWQDVEDGPTRNHPSVMSTQSQTRSKAVTNEEELDEDEAAEDDFIKCPQTTSNTETQKGLNAPTGGSQMAKSKTQNRTVNSLVLEEHSEQGKRKGQQSNNPTKGLATGKEHGANIAANTSQKRHNQGTQSSKKPSISVKDSQRQEQTRLDRDGYSDSIKIPEEHNASTSRNLPSMSLNKSSEKPIVISTTTSGSFAKATAQSQARRAKPLKSKTPIYSNKNKNSTKEKAAEETSDSNILWDLPAIPTEEVTDRTDLAPKVLQKQVPKTTKSATQVPKKTTKASQFKAKPSSALIILDRPRKGKQKSQGIKGNSQAMSTKTPGPPKSGYKGDSHSYDVDYENEDEVFNLQQGDAKELGLVHDNPFSPRSLAAETDLYDATPLKSKAVSKSGLDIITKVPLSPPGNDVPSKLNEMLGDLDDELEKVSPQVLGIKGKSRRRMSLEELQGPALARALAVETKNSDDEAVAEIITKEKPKNYQKQSPSAAKETGASTSPEVEHIEIECHLPSNEVQKDTIKKASVSTRRRSQSVVPVEDFEYAERIDADLDDMVAQIDDSKKRKSKSNMPPPTKRRKTVSVIVPVEKGHSPSPAAKVQMAKDKSPASRTSLRLAKRAKETTEISEPAAEEIPLVDDHAARKTNLISFGAKGPRNQGPSSGARSSVGRHSIINEPAESPFAGPEETSGRKRKLKDVTMDGGDSSKKDSRKKRHSSPRKPVFTDLDDNPQIFNSSPPTQSGPKLNSQGSRVDHNGSPQALGSPQVDHISKLRNKLLVADDVTVNEDAKELFGPSIVLSSGPRTRLESVERSRYVPHKKTLSGHYEDVNSNEVVFPGDALADPFSAKPGKEVNQFTKRLQSGCISGTAVSNASIDCGSPVKDSQLRKYRSSRSAMIPKKIFFERKASPLSQTLAPTLTLHSNITVPKTSADIGNALIQKEKYNTAGRPSSVSTLKASTVDPETTAIKKTQNSKSNRSSEFISNKISTSVEKPVIEKQHSKTARFADIVPDISIDLEKTLVDQCSPSLATSDLTNGTSVESDTPGSTLDEFEASNSSWNIAIRPHYGHYAEALSHVAKEMIIRLSNEEDAVGLMAKQYEENGSKLLEHHLVKREAEKASIIQGLEQKKEDLVQVYTDAKSVASHTLEDLKTTSVTDYRNEWELHQDSIKKEILAGKKACLVGRNGVGKARPAELMLGIVTREDVDTLKDDWLTDNTIAFWEEYLEREELRKYPSSNIVLLRPSMAFMLMQTPDPLSLKEALPDFTATTHIFLPINDARNVSVAEGGSHWSLLLVSVIDGVAFHYDSMSPSNYNEALLATEKIGILLNRELRFLNLEDSPQQENGSDCGVYVCIQMRHLLLKRLLSVNAREKISMSMGGKLIDAAGGRKEMLRTIEGFRKEGERRRS
ncbi:hypothetical protein B7494_g4397 [Chlorociboria aeruginascens]|nr:hypothetical protein B7494_g4397 [Chlorociboria aeruginascens]